MNRKRFLIWEKWRETQHSIDLKELQESLVSRGLASSGTRIQAEKHLKEKYLAEVEMERATMEEEETEVAERARERRNQRRINWVVAGGSFIAALGSVGSMVLALPLFNSQINNIQVKVDSLQESIEQMFERTEKEVFRYPELNNHITANPSGGSIIRLTLAHKPVKGSVNVWWGSMNLSPVYVDIEGQDVVLNFVDHAPENLIAEEGYSDIGFTVSYIRSE